MSIKKHNANYRYKDAEIGYRTRTKEDIFHLTDIYNYYMKNVYNNIELLFDDLTVKSIYPVLYNHLSVILDESIERKTLPLIFYKRLKSEAENKLGIIFAEKKINFFNDKYILSICNFSDLEKAIINFNLASMITNNNDRSSRTESSEMICGAFDISKSEYNAENRKLMQRFSSMKDSKVKVFKR